MEKYRNISGNSGVINYEIGSDYIIVEFKDKSRYLYNYIKPGSSYVEKMKKFAVRGLGLNTFINSYVNKKYYRKIK